MADVKWIKITTDIFDDEKIKIIDTMPDRDALLVVWFKLLALAGKKNESGLLFLSSKMPYTDEMFSTIFNRPINTVRLALQTFESFGMIEIMDNEIISIINWEKHQNVDGMEKMKEQAKLRRRKSDIKRKLKAVGYDDKKAEEIAEKEKKNTVSHVISRYTHAIDKIRIEQNREDKNNNSEKAPVAVSIHRQEIDMKLRQHGLNIRVGDVIKHSKGDIQGAIERLEAFKDKEPGFILAAIRDRYDIPKEKQGFKSPVYTEDEEYSLEGLI